MHSRRLDISSLLCDVHPLSPVPEPVILAPHLRHPHRPSPFNIQPDPRSPSPPAAPIPTRRRLYPDQPMEPPRSLPSSTAHSRPVESAVFQQVHRPSSGEPSYPSQSRPSSSSRSSHSPLVSYSYPHYQQPPMSPSSSPDVQLSALASVGTSPPFYPNVRLSPVLHRPPSSHSVSLPPLQPQQPMLQSRHTPVPQHRSRSNTSPTMNPYPPLSPVRSLASPRTHPSSESPPKPYIGLDVLAHAATEERRRLSNGSSGEPEMSTPPDDAKQRPHIAERQPSAPFHYPSLSRDHPARASERPHEVHVQVSPTISPPQEFKPRASGFFTLPQPQPYLHPHERERRVLEDPHNTLPVDDVTRPVASLPYPISPNAFRRDSDQDMQAKQLQLQRQRQHHELLLQQEHRQHQQRAQEKLMEKTDGVLLSPLGTSIQIKHPHPHPPPPPSSHITSHIALNTIQIDPFPEPAQASQSRSSIPSTRPNKKQRHSASPSRATSNDEWERIRHDRERMAAGDLGYGRLQTSVDGGVHSWKPGSGHRKDRTGVSETKHEKDGPGGDTTLLGAESKEAARPQAPIQEKRGPSTGRRSPPGSHAGRAKATRKLEQGEAASSVEKKEHMSMERVRAQVADDAKKDEPDRNRSRASVEAVTHIDSTRLTKDHRRHTSAPNEQQEDAHEWFLEHYADSLPVAQVLDHNPSPPLSVPPVPSDMHTEHSPSSPKMSKKRTPTPTTMPEAAVALEQELEEVVVEKVVVSKPEPDTAMDVDVDPTVSELLADALEGEEDIKTEDVRMEVDVEDELLSLVDDRPPAPIASRLPSSHGSGTPTQTPQHHIDVPALSVMSDSDVKRVSPPALHTVSAQPPSSMLSGVQVSSARATSERESMPPPASTSGASDRLKEQDEITKKGVRAGSVGAASVKKTKEVSTKPAAKAKAINGPSTKPRAKPKPKGKNTDNILPPKAVKGSTSITKKSASAGARSRSTSAMPGKALVPDADANTEKPEDDEDDDVNNDEDKLYCVCKTKYDEDRFMIACDRCDEWYHTPCVDMPELEVDLVDQFFCPPCIQKYANLSLRTTYKPRCLFGLKHSDPSSTKACHKPARGAFSKYCSDQCGVKYMQSRIDVWAKKGGKKDKLWESLKNAEKREGIVIEAEDHDLSKREGSNGIKDENISLPAVKPKKSKVEREMERLNSLLDQVVKLREEIKKGMEVVLWRERLLELASERAEQVGQCGWDQRLCYTDDESGDFGAEALESYEEPKMNGVEGDDDEIHVDGATGIHGEWWCPGTKMCERHGGWQAVRHKDVCKEKEKKEEALAKLTTREREIRKRIEDIVDSHARDCNEPPTKSPLKSSKLANGHNKGQLNGDLFKRGKKRKAQHAL